MRPRPDTAGYAHVGAALVTGAGSALFGWNQNRGEVVGGPIHWSKVAWINITVTNFVVLPVLWWLRADTSPPVRRVLRMLGLQFVVRGLVELPMIYFTRWWKCGYGISHDALVFALMGHELLRSRAEIRRTPDPAGLAQCGLAMGLLAVEGCFAKMFRSVQDPSTGIYFADDSPKFRRVIRATKAVVFIAYPLMAIVLWMSRRNFARPDPGLGTKRG